MRWPGTLMAVCLCAPLGCRYLRHAAPDAGHAVAAQAVPQVVQIATTDRWPLVGTLYPAANADIDGTAVLLVHQLGSSRAEWAPLVQRLRGRHSIAMLTVDLRGHGDSTHDPQGNTVTWESFGTDPERWARLVQDVAAAVRFLRTEGATRVVIVGSSIGSSAALTVASDATEAADVVGVAMLSPGLSYHGIDTRLPMQHFAASGRPTLMLAGDQDAPSAEALRVLGQTGGTTVEREVYGSRLHGVPLCTATAGCWDHVEAWVRSVLRPTAHPPERSASDGGMAAPGPMPPGGPLTHP